MNVKLHDARCSTEVPSSDCKQMVWLNKFLVAGKHRESGEAGIRHLARASRARRVRLRLTILSPLRLASLLAGINFTAPHLNLGTSSLNLSTMAEYLTIIENSCQMTESRTQQINHYPLRGSMPNRQQQEFVC